MRSRDNRRRKYEENMTIKTDNYKVQRNIPFSLPDITNADINEVVEVLKSGCTTTGHKTKMFEKLITGCFGTDKAFCLILI